MFHKNRFLYRAISPKHAHETVTLKDIQTARSTHRRALRQKINERVSVSPSICRADRPVKRPTLHLIPSGFEAPHLPDG